MNEEYIKLTQEWHRKGFESRQAEINELRSTVEGWKDEYRIMTLRYEGLKKRIDDALKEIDLKGDVETAIKILKGNENEN